MESLDPDDLHPYFELKKASGRRYIELYQEPDTVVLNNDKYIYQEILWSDLEEMPEEEMNSRSIDQYIDELNHLIDFYGEEYEEIIGLDMYSVGAVIHGRLDEALQEIGPVHGASVQEDVMLEIYDETGIEAFTLNPDIHRQGEKEFLVHNFLNKYRKE